MSREEIEPAAAITYETVFLAEPEIPTEQVDQIISKLKETIAAHQGSVASEDRWGRRRLAYPIHGHREGFYSVLTFSAEPTVVAAIEHLYNVTDTILRHLTIRHIKRNKKFAPKRERPAGYTDAHRGPSRSSGPVRPRTDSAPRSPAPSEGAPSAAAPVEKQEASTPQGEKP